MGSVFKAAKSFAEREVKSRVDKFRQERKESTKLKAEANKIRKEIRRKETLRKVRRDEERRIRGPSKAERREKIKRVSQFATNVANLYGMQTPKTQQRTQKRIKSSSILQKQLAKVRREAIKKELIRQTQKKAIKKFRRKKLKTTKEKKRGKQPPQFIRFA